MASHKKIETLIEGESMSQPAITTWSEEEQAFRMAIREFAESVIKPKVHEMDKNQQNGFRSFISAFSNGIDGN